MDNREFSDFVDDVKRQTDIVGVIGSRISLDGNHKAICPFHEETKPSFSVHPTDQYFNCFGCGNGGDVFDFLQQYENITFMEALTALAGELGLAVPCIDQKEMEQISRERLKEEILTVAAQFYHDNLDEASRSDLMEERGFNNQTISRFRIGYAGGGLRKHLTEKCGFEIEDCLDAGVMKKKGDGTIRDYFYKRITFPNIKRGRVVHITARSIDGKEPKYLHLPGHLDYLYNEDALSSRIVFIVEGVPDCITLVQEGYSAVATLGVNQFREEYLPKFNGCETVYICLDGDKAGLEGALRIGRMIGERARIVQIPKVLDVNDYFRHNTRKDFDQIVEDSEDVISHMLSLIPEDTDKTKLVKELEPILRELAALEEAEAESYLSYKIKPRFKLKKQDVEAYRKRIKRYRGEEKESQRIRDEQSDAKASYTANFPGLIDIVDQDGNPAFLVKQDGVLTIERQYVIDGVTYQPPPSGKLPWLLPRGEEVLRHFEVQSELSTLEVDTSLYNDLVAYHKSISDFPDEAYYDLITAWDLHTYLWEDCQYTPIICLFAVPERGKSRTGKGMIYVAYRGIYVESLRDAYIVRIAENLHSSIFFDVKDIWRKAEKNGTEDILLHRYEKGAKVPRVMYPERGAFRDTEYFSIFGPTVIGTNMGVDQILETRAITINMPETDKRFENDVTPEHARPLRERLVAFRARHLGEPLPKVSKPAHSRLGDILKPLLQIFRLVNPSREAAFLVLIKKLETKRLMEKSESIEAQIIRAIYALRDRVEHGSLPVMTITDEVNRGKNERYQLTKQKVGRRLDSLGFSKCKADDGASAIELSEEQVERLMDSYGLRKTSVTSDTSVLPGDETGISDVSDVSSTPF